MADYIYLIILCGISVAAIVVGLKMRVSHKKRVVERARLTVIEIKRLELLQSVKKIEWGDQFAIDGGIIDENNRGLFQLINEFNDEIPSLKSPEQITPILTSLLKYTRTHFPSEEKLQQLTAFPFCEDHKKEHEALVNGLKELIEKTVRANEGNIIDVAAEIGLFLKMWLSEHIIESDLPLKPYVDRMRKDVKSTDEPASGRLQ